eukprot:TRINITY_DN23499_c0_g1_i1.p1 TRINITY_DN23499_c0_g1~~TRINITY_DN23499_c0_g1_i1.p1  ORF type:complete len:308 (+),score=21.73 TRINITY_DN23499_c0_g1_i1:419-1342(+)
MSTEASNTSSGIDRHDNNTIPEWNADTMKVPVHVGVICDGNGRWAKMRGKRRIYGHEAGVDSVRVLVRSCGELGVGTLTIYAFSSENWRRPAAEVDHLFSLITSYLESEAEEMMENNVRFAVIGQVERLPAKVQEIIHNMTHTTRNNTGLHLQIALSYGGRAELTRATQLIASKVRDGLMRAEDITDDTIEQHLYTAGVPSPDLIIRSAGEMRLSNFLLWQCAYAELYVTETLWPDFRRKDLERAFAVFNMRTRRYGMTDEQVEKTAPNVDGATASAIPNSRSGSGDVQVVVSGDSASNSHSPDPSH